MCIRSTTSAIVALADLANPPDPSWPCLTHVEPVYGPGPGPYGDGVVALTIPRRHPRPCTQAEADALAEFDAYCLAIRNGSQP